MVPPTWFTLEGAPSGLTLAPLESLLPKMLRFRTNWGMYHFCPFPKEGGSPHLPSVGLTLRSLCSPTTCLPRFSLIYRRKLPALSRPRLPTWLSMKTGSRIDVPVGFRNRKLSFKKKMLAPGFFPNYPNTQMCWNGIKIESLSTTGWKVKSKMEEMPNDLEKEKIQLH